MKHCDPVLQGFLHHGRIALVSEKIRVLLSGTLVSAAWSCSRFVPVNRELSLSEESRKEEEQRKCFCSSAAC